MKNAQFSRLLRTTSRECYGILIHPTNTVIDKKICGLQSVFMHITFVCTESGYVDQFLVLNITFVTRVSQKIVKIVPAKSLFSKKSNDIIQSLRSIVETIVTHTKIVTQRQIWARFWPRGFGRRRGFVRQKNHLRK